MTMTLVQTVTVGAGGAASIEFTSIPQTGQDLLLRVSVRNDSNAFAYWLEFNSDTSNTNYATLWLRGSGSAVDSFAFPEGRYGAYGNSNTATASTFSNDSIYVTNYTSSTAKSYSIDGVTENNATLAYQLLSAGRWTGTAGITAVKIYPSSGGNFAQYSTASLYTISTTGATGATVS